MLRSKPANRDDDAPDDDCAVDLENGDDAPEAVGSQSKPDTRSFDLGLSTFRLETLRRFTHPQDAGR